MSTTQLLNEWEIAQRHSGACIGPNQWLENDNTPVLTVINPNNEQIIGEVQTCSLSNYHKIIDAAQSAFRIWRKVPAPKRGELVRQIGHALRLRKSSLARLVTLEMGKSLAEAEGEVQEMIDMADFAVGQSRMLYGLTMHSERPQHRLYEQWHPMGVVGVITAFNFPVAVWAWNAFIAAIAGNTVVWKPSSKVPLCALAVQNICNEVMMSNGYSGIFNLCVTNDKKIADIILKDERLPLISFTGSTHVGEHVSSVVASRLGRSLLELGGNNAIIVDESANLKLAVPAIVFGAIGTAGQRCTSTRRLFVHESIFDHLCDLLVTAYKSVKVGDPSSSSNHVGPLIDKAAVDSYLRAIAEVKAQHGKILFGGKALPGAGFYVEPTLVVADAHLPIVQQETFAPILYLHKFSDLNEAMALQNSTPYALSSAIFTQNLNNAEYFLSALGSDCGIANVNIGTSGAEIGGAFGGEKKTGGGREAGSDAWKAYMRRQTCTINWGNSLPLAQGINFALD